MCSVADGTTVPFEDPRQLQVWLQARFKEYAARVAPQLLSAGFDRPSKFDASRQSALTVRPPPAIEVLCVALHGMACLCGVLWQFRTALFLPFVLHLSLVSLDMGMPCV